MPKSSASRERQAPACSGRERPTAIKIITQINCNVAICLFYSSPTEKGGSELSLWFVFPQTKGRSVQSLWFFLPWRKAGTGLHRDSRFMYFVRFSTDKGEKRTVSLLLSPVEKEVKFLFYNYLKQSLAAQRQTTNQFTAAGRCLPLPGVPGRRRSLPPLAAKRQITNLFFAAGRRLPLPGVPGRRLSRERWPRRRWRMKRTE